MLMLSSMLGCSYGRIDGSMMLHNLVAPRSATKRDRTAVSATSLMILKQAVLSNTAG